jgi:CheY-like chemotaxis protein/tRNA A-37 threonylcarbamoyl transferase component Bud32
MKPEKKTTDTIAEKNGGLEQPVIDLSGLSALAVSFEEHGRGLLTEVLRELGFGEVLGASGVSDALAEIRKSHLDLMVSDLEAHRLEEVDLIRNAVALDPDLPIIVVSGYATIEWGVELMKAGVRDVVRKPLDVPVFRKKILRLLAEMASDGGSPPHLIGPFRIIEEMERGGMGIIYKAQNPDTEEVVALKVLPASAHSSMNQILRFRKEAEAISRLDHPYIVALKGNGFSGKRYYLAMELIEGVAMDILAYETRLHYRRLAPIVVKILEALEYAHDREILHRDLKPSNILIDGEDKPHIIDFGLAQYLKGDVRLTKTGVVMGTIGYIAPERIRGRPAGPASDVYSVGAILYECLTRQIPYETESRVITIPTSYDQLVPPRDLLPGIPEDLEEVCMKALAISPGNRFPTAAKFREALEKCIEKM